MRRRMMLAALVAGEVLLVVAVRVSSAQAQPFGFFFGERPQRSYRPQRRQRAAQPAPVIPLPVPRPHFADDPRPVASPATVAAKPVDAAREPQPAVRMGPPAPPSTPPVPSPKPDSAPPLTVPVTTPTPPSPPPKPADLEQPKPGIAASGATTTFTPRQPDDDASCPGRLKAQNVSAEPTSVGPQPDDRCTVVQAVRLASLKLPDGEEITFPDKPLLACATAETFSTYVRDLLSPLAKGTFGTRVGAVWTGPGLECRSRDHIFGAKLSAHGQGLAIDIAQLKLVDGRTIAVGQPTTPQDQSFESAARAAGCGYFHTVLGPGSDTYHRTHWHFDLEVRGAKGDTKYCH